MPKVEATVRIGNVVASATLNPTGNPRYVVRAKCESPDVSDTFKAVRVKFRDVNKFSSPANQDYNFSFSAKTDLGGQATITVRAFKDFGTGGSPEEDIFITTKTITNSFVTYSEAFTVPDNIGKTIGSNDDDFVCFEISFSTSILF